MKKLLNIVSIALLGVGLLYCAPKVEAQCAGVFPPGYLCGNPSVSAAPPGPYPTIQFSSSIVVPPVTTSSDIVLFGNTTGSKLSDSGLIFSVTGTGAIVLATSPAIANAAITGNTSINTTNTTQSTSVSTGAIVDAGGIGVAKNAYVGGVINGGGTFVTGENYGASNGQTMGYQGTLGSSGSPTTLGDAPWIFQKFSNVASASNTNPTIYVQAFKYSSTTSTGRAVAIYGECDDKVGGTDSFCEGGRFQSTLTVSSSAEANGVICSAGDDVGVTYNYIIGCEADVENNSGTDATVVFNQNKFIAGFLASNFASGKSDVGFITNPFSTTPFIYGFLVPASSIDSSGTAFISNASANNGLDLSQGTWASNAIVIPNNSPISALNSAATSGLNLMYLNNSNHLILGAGTASPGVNCASGTVNPSTMVVTGGVVTHC